MAETMTTRPAWYGDETWNFENESDEWMDGYVHATHGYCYDHELDTGEMLYYFSEHLGELIFVENVPEV